MSLHTNNDNESNWSGTDGADTYNVAIQGSNSESWLVSKNTTETGTLSLSNNISGTGVQFLFWLKSDLSYYYTSVTAELQSTTNNYRSYTLATSSDPQVSGDFKSFALDVNSGGTQTGTFAPASFATTRIILNNSSSGNIRSVINTWIDAMYYGTGLSFTGGTDTNDTMFAEAAAIDQNGTNEYGVLQNYEDIIYAQASLSFDDGGATVTQKSIGETLVFKETDNGTNSYDLELLGDTNTVEWTNTTVKANGTARFSLTASGTINSFTMSGVNLTKASSVALKTGQSHDTVNFTECGEVDPNNAAMDGVNFIDTIETTTGALIVNAEAEAENISNANFSGYSANSRYAVYVAASVTQFDMDNWQFDDPNNTTDYAVYWAGTSGTLTIYAINGTNLVTAGCTAASGGTVSVVAGSRTITLTAQTDTGTKIQDARAFLATAESGTLPYQSSVTSITRSGTTATATFAAAHNLKTGDKILWAGITDKTEDNATFTVTVSSTTVVTYTTTDSGSTNYTGTITGTFVYLKGLTDVNGQISLTRVIDTTQAATGWARKSSSAPYYKQGSVSGDVSSSENTNFTATLISDD